MAARNGRRFTQATILGFTILLITSVGGAGATQSVETTAKPMISQIHLSAHSVSWLGGTITMTARVTHSFGCQLTTKGVVPVAAQYLPASVLCVKGGFHTRILLSPNIGLVPTHLTFRFHATSASGAEV